MYERITLKIFEKYNNRSEYFYDTRLSGLVLYLTIRSYFMYIVSLGNFTIDEKSLLFIYPDKTSKYNDIKKINYTKINYKKVNELCNTAVHTFVKVFLLNYFNNFFFKSIFFFFKYWVVSFILSVSILIILLVNRLIPFNKFIFMLVSVGFFIYILISGFIFFFKKYRYGKYTSAMNRFWRRTFSIFWLLEGFLFIIFLYLVIFSSQESFFMYDNQQAFKDFTYSWRDFIQESSIVMSIIIILYKFQLRLKDLSYIKIFILLLAVTVVLLILTWVEFYQFYYVVMHYNGVDWLFDDETNLWVIEPEIKKTRIMLHFLTICLIAKFWHFVFILAFWIFTVTRWIQSNNIFYSLYGANIQNFIILYLLNCIIMYSWLKLSIRNQLYRGYLWTYTNFRITKLKLFIIEFENYACALVNLFYTYLYSLNNLYSACLNKSLFF